MSDPGHSSSGRPPQAYVPASSAAWLDFDAAAGERVTTLIRALEQPGTLDVLGLGAVRDGFADMFHPGTSTVQTRLRYFVFLPWIFRALERRRVPPARFADELKTSEAKLIDCLRGVGEGKGVIGYHAGDRLSRWPSAVYWGGLGAWGLRRLDLTVTEYGRLLRSFSDGDVDRDDDGNAVLSPWAMWATMPAAPDDFLAAPLDFDLEPTEADHLVDHLRRACRDSLLAALVADPTVAAGADFPWDLPPEVVPAALREPLHHAQCFSELTVGPQHVYNLLLARKARAQLGWETAALEERVSRELERWATMVAGRDVLRAWTYDMGACWDVLRRSGVELSEPTRGFLEAILRRAAVDPVTFAEDPDVHAPIVAREHQLKQGRARLSSRSALEGWNGQPFGGQLVFRWPTARSYLADLATAQGR